MVSCNNKVASSRMRQQTQTRSDYQRRINRILWLCLLLSTTAIHFSAIGYTYRPVGLYVSANNNHDRHRNPSSSSSSSQTHSSATYTGSRSLHYQRYRSYPPYCSDPIEMSTRKIPPLPKDSNNNTRLVHVTAIIRHGARTPIHSKSCWQGHLDEPDGIWDCQLTTLLSTRPPYYKGQQSGSGDDAMDEGDFLVEKIYDAFLGDKFPSPYRNRLNGTCQAGQLLQQGYDQQNFNGQYLRDAYIHDDGTSGDTDDPSRNSGDPRLRLFTTSSSFKNNNKNNNENDNSNSNNDGSTEQMFLDGSLRYRSDDDQRTLASGQVLLSSMFGPEVLAYRKAHNGANPVITHHTADRWNDILSSVRGKMMCSTQQAAMERSHKSNEYQAFINSEESALMRQLIDDELEPEGVHFGGLDCMMTSICTDRSMPDVINDYKSEKIDKNDDDDDNNQYTKKYGPNRFERLLDYVIENKTMASRFNDSELSKMDMGPLWAEIMDHITPVVVKKKKANEDDENKNNDNVKFALYSGHDSTVLPLMASLGVWNTTDFPLYASMMIVEIHEVIDQVTSDFPSGYAFRLVYNGRVLTWLMEGCPEYSHLCDISVFMNRVTPFATRKHRGCGVEEVDNTSTTSSPPRISFWSKSETFATTDASLFLIMSMIASFILGSLMTCGVMQCCRWRPRRQQRDESELVSMGKDHTIEFMGEPDIVID